MLSAILSSKVVLVVVTLAGMALCAAGGIGKVAAQGQWLNPFAIVGYIVGAVILLIVGAALLGIKLPLVDSTEAAFIAVIALVIVKVALTQLHHALG